ncbi:MAG: TolB protein [Gaiellaceae bacterium]|nr:TolB protein [Gaiellaceae bacterium]
MDRLRPLVGQAVAVAALACLGGSAARAASPAQIWVSARDPAWANGPGRGRIAYSRVVARRGRLTSDVYVVRADGSHLRLLRKGAASAAWSPDGRRLAFTHNGYVELARPDGTLIRRLARGSEPAWSADGRRLAYVDNRGLAVVDADGANRLQLVLTSTAVGGSFPSDPSWSPDGKTLAFVYGGYKVGIVPADGGAVRSLGYGSSAAWSPDGIRLAVSCRHAAAVVIESPTGGDQSCDAGAQAVTGPPRWSPSGTTLVFEGCDNVSCWVTLRRGDGSFVRLARGHQPAWSPRGDEILFGHDISPTRQLLYRIRPDGTHLRPLLPPRK